MSKAQSNFKRRDAETQRRRENQEITLFLSGPPRLCVEFLIFPCEVGRAFFEECGYAFLEIGGFARFDLASVF